MAMTNAEKQRRYRERLRAKALEAKPVDLSALRKTVEELYDARAKPSEWRIRMRDEIGKLGG